MNKFQNLPDLFFTKAKLNKNKEHLLKLDNSSNKIKSFKWSDTTNLIYKIHNFLENKKFITRYETHKDFGLAIPFEK